MKVVEINSVETVKRIEMETNRIPRIIQLIMKNYRNQPVVVLLWQRELPALTSQRVNIVLTQTI